MEQDSPHVYPDRANPALLDRIPLSASAVLDVGCGSGALGLAYRALNPRARLFGIEANAEAARIARQRLDSVAEVDIDADPLPFGPDRQFSCIVYGDSLEHFRDPWRILREQARTLVEHGTILISIPNIEHWSFVFRLLDGSWDYAETGLLDRTHLRWFTFDTMRRGLRECGLWPIDCSPQIHDMESARAFLAAITPALANMNVDSAGWLRRAAPLQYVWRAQSEPVQRLHVAATMLDHVGGVSRVRIVDPLQAIATDPSVTTAVVQGGAIPAGLDTMTPKILILHRPILVGAPGLRTIRSLLDDDWIIVTEFDDHPDFFPQLRGDDNFVFRSVHAVQTSTDPLAEVLRERNPEVKVFPNAVRICQEPRNFAEPGRLTLFFAGLNREDDWQPFIGGLNEAARAAGNRLHFHIVHDRALFDRIASPHKKFTPLCDYDTYFQLLAGCEVSFMPLADTWFNRTKSDLKFIEAASCRVVAVASETVYAGSIVDGETGIVVRSADELRPRLLELIGERDRALRIAAAGQDWVRRRRMLAYQVADRVAWYRSLWQRRKELGAALLERTPELASSELA